MKNPHDILVGQFEYAAILEGQEKKSWMVEESYMEGRLVPDTVIKIKLSTNQTNVVLMFGG